MSAARSSCASLHGFPCTPKHQIAVVQKAVRGSEGALTPALITAAVLISTLSKLNSSTNSCLDGVGYLKTLYLLWDDTFLVLCQGIREK